MSEPSGIHKGTDWGVPSRVPENAVSCHGDSDVARASGPVVLLGGDLYRSVGRPSPRSVGEASTLLRIDSLICSVESDVGCVEIPAAAHVAIGRFVGRSRFVACVNAGFMGEMSISPRSHPGDGRFEIVEFDASMGFRKRLMARRRAKTGNHVPHPAIRTTSAVSWSTHREGREALRIDGVPIDTWNRIEIRLEPGSLTVHL